jgi:hypothetical protein
MFTVHRFYLRSTNERFNKGYGGSVFGMPLPLHVTTQEQGVRWVKRWFKTYLSWFVRGGDEESFRGSFWLVKETSLKTQIRYFWQICFLNTGM